MTLKLGRLPHDPAKPRLKAASFPPPPWWWGWLIWD